MNYAEKTSRRLPFLQSERTTGFQSPAADFEEGRLDLFEHIIRNPEATFFARAETDDMRDAGIQRNDIFVVDRSLRPFHLAWVIIFHESERRFGRLHWLPGAVPRLIFANKNLPPIALDPADAWGIITWIIRPADY